MLRDNLHRKKSQKKALRIISQARKARAKETARLGKEALDFLINNPFPETEPTFSKRDDIYRQNAKKKSYKNNTSSKKSEG